MAIVHRPINSEIGCRPPKGVKLRNRAFLCMPIVLLGACSSIVALHQGPKLPRDQSALVYAGYGTKLIRIDDHSLGGNGRDKKYEVIPGLHTVSLTTFTVGNYIIMYHTIWTRPTTICLDAKAGHEYTFDRQEALRTFKIIDMATNKEVPGIDCPARYDERDTEEWKKRPW
jgi:hypothetical protein